MSAVEEQEKPRRGNPTWYSGMPSANPNGRSKVLDKDKKSNKMLRNEELLSLVRKFKPHLSKAVMAAVSILENKESNEGNKLRASAMILTLYKDLLKDLYHKDYDLDEGMEIQQTSAPILSLTMVKDNKED